MPDYLNKYECECGCEWDDVWDCMCNDRCPDCNRETNPKESIDLTEGG